MRASSAKELRSHHPCQSCTTSWLRAAPLPARQRAAVEQYRMFKVWSGRSQRKSLVRNPMKPELPSLRAAWRGRGQRRRLGVLRLPPLVFRSQRVVPAVIPGLVPRIHPSTCAGTSGWMDGRDLGTRPRAIKPDHHNPGTERKCQGASIVPNPTEALFEVKPKMSWRSQHQAAVARS